jgi:hypothetical protein
MSQLLIKIVAIDTNFFFKNQFYMEETMAQIL